MASRQNTSMYKATASILIAVTIVAGCISAADAVACTNAIPAASAAYCSALSTVVPATAQLSPCNADPGCGSVRSTPTSTTATCAPLDQYCCAQTDCYAANTGGSCKNGTTLSCTSSGTTPTTTTTTTTNSSVPTSSGGGSSGITAEALVNTTSNTVLVCYNIPILATVS